MLKSIITPIFMATLVLSMPLSASQQQPNPPARQAEEQQQPPLPIKKKIVRQHVKPQQHATKPQQHAKPEQRIKKRIVRKRVNPPAPYSKAPRKIIIRKRVRPSQPHYYEETRVYRYYEPRAYYPAPVMGLHFMLPL